MMNMDNAMLIDIQYVKANRRQNQPDYLYVIWKDLLTKQKHLQAIPEPKMEIYFEKPEYRNHDYCRSYARLDEVDKKVVKYKNIIYEIANEMGPAGREKLNYCFNTRNYNALKEFYVYPYVYGADYDVRVWYRNKWLEQFDNDRPKEISYGFMDIEVDSFEARGMADPAYCPIDLVTLIDVTSNTSYTFSLVGVCGEAKDTAKMKRKEREHELYRRHMYQQRLQQQAIITEDVDYLVKKAHERFDETYPGMEYKFYFYKDEAKMLVHLFQLINRLKLDFIGVWNISFDIPYIMERLRVLGLDPAEVMCHPDFPVKECWFKKDNRNFQVKNKGDFFHISSYTVFVDQMINYAAIRKGRSELRNYKLTYIAKKELNDEKLDYSEGGNIKTISYNDFLTYILYNIKDVLLQKGIEQRTADLETYWIASYYNITAYENVFKQTVKLRSAQYHSYMKQGLVPGENVNIFYYGVEKEEDEDEESSFEGALVGNPKLIDYFGMRLYGKRTNSIFRFSIDFDMSSFYPSTIAAMNIEPSNLIFKVILDCTQYDVRGGKLPFHGITDIQIVEENDDSFKDDIAKEVFDNFQTKDYLSFGHKWMNLPSVEEVYDELVKELGEVSVA